MKRSLRNLRGFDVGATDGSVGGVEDFLFDDERWVIRYLVVNTGGFTSGRRILVSPMLVEDASYDQRLIRLMVTTRKLSSSPHLDTQKPISRKLEESLHWYYDVPAYWGGVGCGDPA
jgi:hypothetical protein